MPAASTTSGAQAGLTLTELLIATAIGLSLLLAATALLITVKNAYLEADDSARIDDTGRYAMDIVGRAIRQAGHRPLDSQGVREGKDDPIISGLDATALDAGSTNWSDPASTAAVNGSDALVTRFFGSGDGAADGAILNCVGIAIAAPASALASPAGSAFFVADATDGEPELRCKYLAMDGKWNSAQIARGVESFQVAYGIDADGDHLPERFLPARHLSANQWKQVVAVRVGMLVHGASRQGMTAPDTVFHLLGPDYSAAFPADSGVALEAKKLRVPGRQRRLFQRTFWLQNGERA